MSKDVTKMTDREIVKRYASLHKQSVKVVETLIKENLGAYKFADLAKMERPTRASTKYVKIVEECRSLMNEARSRFGPDLICIDQLLWKVR